MSYDMKEVEEQVLELLVAATHETDEMPVRACFDGKWDNYSASDYAELIKESDPDATCSFSLSFIRGSRAAVFFVKTGSNNVVMVPVPEGEWKADMSITAVEMLRDVYSKLLNISMDMIKASKTGVKNGL